MLAGEEGHYLASVFAGLLGRLLLLGVQQGLFLDFLVALFRLGHDRAPLGAPAKAGCLTTIGPVCLLYTSRCV